VSGIKGYRPSRQAAKLHAERLAETAHIKRSRAGAHDSQQKQLEQLEQLEQLDREMALYWLRNYPAYRQLIRERVSRAAKKAEIRSRKFDQDYRDVDYLGAEIEGCG